MDANKLTKAKEIAQAIRLNDLTFEDIEKATEMNRLMREIYSTISDDYDKLLLVSKFIKNDYKFTDVEKDYADADERVQEIMERLKPKTK